MENGDIICPVCLLQYGSNVKPRQLSCGHASCTSCVGQMILNGHLHCSECRKPFYANSAEELPVNYPLLRLVQHFVDVTSRPGNRQTDAGMCEDHGAIKYFKCMHCAEYTCHDCNELRHKSATCRVITVRDALQEMKQIQIDRLTTQKEALKEACSEIEDNIKKIKQEIEARESLKEDLQRKLIEEDKTIESITMKLSKAEIALTEAQKALDQISEAEKKIVRAETISRVNTRIKESTSLIEKQDAKSYVSKSEESAKRQKVSHQPQKCLLINMDFSQDVYAVYEVQGRRKWAKVTSEKNMCFLHALTFNEPPHGALIIPWQSIRGQVKRNNTSVFLHFECQDYKWRLIARMIGDTPRGQQFVMLCTGERGHSYRFVRGRNVYFKGMEGEHFSMHGPHYDDGFPVPSLVDNITENGVYRKKIAPGLITGAALADPNMEPLQFFIRTREWSSEAFSATGFGEVLEGMDYIDATIKHNLIKRLRVIDCGVIIPF